ncbi:MAG TPA: cobalamin-dependent protein [Acidimicrobiia bacterium]
MHPREIMQRRYRVLIAEPRDARGRDTDVLAEALRDAGFEVIDVGSFGVPAQVADASLQEDVDAVGILGVSGHVALVPQVVARLAADGRADALVFTAGTVAPDERATLEAAGVDRIVPTGASPSEVAAWLRESLSARESVAG